MQNSDVLYCEKLIPDAKPTFDLYSFFALINSLTAKLKELI